MSTGSAWVHCQTSCGSALLCDLLFVQTKLSQEIFSHMASHSSGCVSSKFSWQLVLVSLSEARLAGGASDSFLAHGSLSVIVSHSRLLLSDAEDEDTLCHFVVSQMETLTRFFPSEGQPRVCSPDEE